MLGVLKPALAPRNDLRIGVRPPGVLSPAAPEGFGHPLWSAASDFRMLGLVAQGRQHPQLQRCRNRGDEDVGTERALP
jgi:hypothetical protein